MKEYWVCDCCGQQAILSELVFEGEWAYCKKCWEQISKGEEPREEEYGDL
jgi:hypothetical protein